MKSNESNTPSPVQPSNDLPAGPDPLSECADCNQCADRREPTDYEKRLDAIRERSYNLKPEQIQSAFYFLFGSFQVPTMSEADLQRFEWAVTRGECA